MKSLLMVLLLLGGQPGGDPAPLAKRWYTLTTHPGYEGYGALNARGEVMVEWHRRAGTPAVVRGPAPAAARAPWFAPGCANGQCGAPW